MLDALDSDDDSGEDENDEDSGYHVVCSGGLSRVSSGTPFEVWWGRVLQERTVGGKVVFVERCDLGALNDCRLSTYAPHLVDQNGGPEGSQKRHKFGCFAFVTSCARGIDELVIKRSNAHVLSLLYQNCSDSSHALWLPVMKLLPRSGN